MKEVCEMFGVKRSREEKSYTSDKKQHFSPLIPPPVIRQPAQLDLRENVSTLSDTRG